MSQTGQPARTATSDANANFVNPPAVKAAGRTATSTSIRATSDTEQAAQNLGSSLGRAFHTALKDKAGNINARREMKGANEQGTKSAISDIDKDKQRGGWAEAIWGQNPEWRGIQQRAVSNNIMQMQLEQANKMSEYAADDSDAYGKRLTGQLEEQLKKYPNDPETQQIITADWAKASEMLSKQQAKEHYGHSLMQAREISYNGIMTTFDMFNSQSQQVTNEEGAVELDGRAKSFFRLEGLAKGQDKSAYRADIGRAIVANLEGGNIGAFNMAKDNSFFDSYNIEERNVLDKAIGKYDTRSAARVNLTIAQTEAAMLEAQTTDEVDAIYAESEQILQDHAGRTSGSAAYWVSVTNASNKIKKMKAPAVEAAIKREVAFEKNEQLVESILLGEGEKVMRQLDVKNAVDSGDPTNLYDLGIVKPAEQVQALKSIERSIVEGTTGEENLSNGDVLKTVLGNPPLAAQVVSNWKSTTGSSGLLKTAVSAYIGGFDSPSMVDEDHKPREVAKTTMSVLAQYESADRAKFMADLGSDDYAKYTIIKDGMLAGKTSDSIKAEIALDMEAKGNMDVYAGSWAQVLNYDETRSNKRDYVAGIYKDTTKATIGGLMLGNMMEKYNAGLRQGKGDHAYAKGYLKDHINNKSQTVFGNVIHNADGAGLKELELNVFLKGLQSDKNNLAAGLITASMGNTENDDAAIIRKFDGPELKDKVKIIVPAGGGLLFSSPSFISGPIYMAPDKVERYERVLLQNEEDATLKQEIIKDSKLKQKEMDKITDTSNTGKF